MNLNVLFSLCVSSSPIIADEVCLQLLNEKDVVGVIVRLMEELPTHHGLQKVKQYSSCYVSLILLPTYIHTHAHLY